MKTLLIMLGLLFVLAQTYTQDNPLSRVYYVTDTVNGSAGGDTVDVYGQGFRERFKINFVPDSTSKISITADYSSTTTIDVRVNSTVIESYATPAGVWYDPKVIRKLYIRKNTSVVAGAMTYRLYIEGR